MEAGELDGLASRLESLPLVEGGSGRAELRAEVEVASKLLRYALAFDARRPAEAPIVIGIVGGTNVGKSTVFNLLANRTVSLVSPLARETKAPCAFASREAWTIIEESFLPDYARAVLSDPRDPSRPDESSHKLFVSASENGMSSGIVLVDAPDIDGNYAPNHTRALDVLFASDGVVFVASPEKYNDEVCVEFLSRAATYGKRIWAVANKGMAPEALDDFASEVVPRAASSARVIGPIALPYASDGKPGAPADLLAVRDAWRDAAAIRKAARRGARGVVVGIGRHLLDRAALEASALSRYAEGLERTVNEAADAHARFVSELVERNRFFELDDVYRGVLAELKTPILDDVYDGVRAASRWVFSFFGGGSRAGDEAREARRAAELVHTSELFYGVYEDLVALSAGLPSSLAGAAKTWVQAPPSVDETSRRLEAYTGVVESFTSAWIASKTQAEIAHWRDHPFKAGFLRVMKTVLRLGGMGAGILLTGHIGLHDLVTGPAAERLVGLLWRYGEEKLYFDRIRADFVEGRRALFRGFLEREVLEPGRKALPPPPSPEDREGIRASLEALEAEERL